jgi:hypothetical protein
MVNQHKSLSEKIGCVSHATKDDCLADLQCSHGEKRGCFSRRYVADGRVYTGRGSNQYYDDPSKALRGPRSGSESGSQRGRSESPAPSQTSSSSSARRLRRDARIPQNAEDKTSFCAVYTGNEAGCKKWDPACQYVKGGQCRFKPDDVTSETRLPASEYIYHASYRSNSPERSKGGYEPEWLRGDYEEPARTEEPTEAQNPIPPPRSRKPSMTSKASSGPASPTLSDQLSKQQDQFEQFRKSTGRKGPKTRSYQLPTPPPEDNCDDDGKVILSIVFNSNAAACKYGKAFGETGGEPLNHVINKQKLVYFLDRDNDTVKDLVDALVKLAKDSKTYVSHEVDW